ncbi:MBL fold metallo-hydrolase [Desulfosporosinus lacus]|uniref:Metal-dependent hydrolase, beta-lactamase superfamily II n=1 Tax=Desulfosporosinus lacus DSM 15449 TaxID=1121420 RepID=A0A1M5QQD0_9FIRM|nr:MBL fold metallo-hydrolase [Desulfosporosinus lacus]SHH16322.1 Metal-dependent hydrolase, beta-lactamase superfamily II [Desulfosporosinus lacus DSM 15449]
MVLRKSKLLWAFVLLVCIVLLGSGCGNKSTPTAPDSTTGTANTQKLAEPSQASTSSETAKDTPPSNQSTATPSPTQSPPTSTQVNGTLQVHFIDVGQADSILIKASDGTAVLIDGGNNPDGPDVVNYLKSQQVKVLAAVVATHPHEDHIGGLDTVIKNFPVKAVYMPNASSTTKTFEYFISAVTAGGAKRIQAKAGVTLDVPGLTGQFIAPNGSAYEELNDYSAVLRLTFGKITFLFTGDAGELSESEMLKSGQSLKAEVLKVGHHGSATSTSNAFLKAVSPDYAIISVGAGNDYGHPTASALSRLGGAGVMLFRTDQDGTIVATCDGETVTFNKKGSMPSSASPTTSPTPAIQPPASSGSVSIASIDLGGEVVTLVNNGGSAVDLTGWKIVSEKGNQAYSFPGGTTIPPGGTLKVLSGPKAVAGTSALVWTKSNMWNNDGDPGALYNSQGKVVSSK